jgi:putative heme-binding domain-containing protein
MGIVGNNRGARRRIAPACVEGMRRLTRAITVVVSLLYAFSVSPPSLAQRTAAEQAVEKGGQLFNASCRACHGEAGVGNRAPALRGARLTIDYLTRVIAAGKPGTMMPSFHNVFSAEQIRELALYIRSVQRPDSPWAALRGTAAAGEKVFFDPEQTHSCHVCHSFQGRGARVGPDLTAKLKGKTPREIFQKIVIVPHRSADPAYANVAITLRGGERLVGIKGEQTDAGLRFYDTSELPPKVLTLAAADIVSTKPLTGSAMPSDYASRLPLQHLLDLVAYLKTGTEGKAVAVGFDDVIADRPASRR